MAQVPSKKHPWRNFGFGKQNPGASVAKEIYQKASDRQSKLKAAREEANRIRSNKYYQENREYINGLKSARYHSRKQQEVTV